MKRDTLPQIQHEWADKPNGERVHISKAISGRRGYFCPACKREMIAKIGDVLTKHFAHDPKDVEHKGQCTYSDETYRHKVAKSILQHIKQIRVPALRVPPPAGIEGKERKIRDAETRFAHRVEIELHFYEDDNGEVKWGRLTPASTATRHLLFQPDVAFFDATNKPILLIEVVATHKIDEEKILKIRRLGIDTVQVAIPKASEQDIEEIFHRTSRTKWVYNYEREATQYVSISGGDSTPLPPIDEHEAGFLEFEETYSCRTSEIGNLIRSINRCLEGEQYRTIAQRLADDLARVEDHAAGVGRRLHGVREERRKGVEARFEDAFAEIKEKIRLEDLEYEDLEGRYSRKKRELIDATANVQPESKEELAALEREIEKLEGDLNRLGKGARTVDEQRASIAAEEGRIAAKTRSVKSAIAEFPGLESDYQEQERLRIKRVQVEIEREIASTESDIRNEEDRLVRGTNRFCRQLAEAVAAGNVRGIEGISPRFAELFEARRHILHITRERSFLRRIKQAQECVARGAYKNWLH